MHVVIIGLTRRDQERATKRLFSYDDINGDPTESTHKALTPYLFDAGKVVDRHLVVKEVSKSLSGAPKTVIGSKPIDDGQYIFSDEERVEFLKVEPQAAPFLRPFVGAKEYIAGNHRWILALDDVPPQTLRAMPHVKKRIVAVRAFRKKSISEQTQELGDTPTRFHVTVIPDQPYLVIPESSSERREYAPIGWLEPPTIPSSLVRVMLNADLWHFGVLTSAIHMAWLRHIGGRLKSDYRYSIGLVYNTFPWPDATDKQKDNIRTLAQAVLDARAKYPGATLADLYDPDLMKAELRKAHRALDAAVDKLYRKKAFQGDRDRAEHLFGLYEKLVSPLTAAPRRPRRRRAASPR